MQSTTRDWVAGGFVMVGLAAMVFLSVQIGGASYAGPGGLRLVAHFDEIGGLSERAPVVISGVRVGQVESITLADDLRARVEIDRRRSPGAADRQRAAAIRTAGLLGDQFVAVEPGAEDELLVSGDRFQFSDSAVQLDSLIGSLVHGVEAE